MTKLLVISFVLFTGQLFGQKVLKFKLSDMAIQNIDTLVISPFFFDPKPQIFQIRNSKEEFLFVKSYNDTLNLEAKPYSLLKLTGLKKITTDTIDISFIQLNKFQYTDTIIFSVKKRNLFSKNYRTIQQDTTIHTSKSGIIQPMETCEISINSVRIILNLITRDSVSYDIGCGKRVSYSKQTKKHEVFYYFDI